MNVNPTLTVCTVDIDCSPVLLAPSTPTPTATTVVLTDTPTPTPAPLDCDNNIVAGNNNPLSDRGYWRGGFNIGTIDTNAYPLEVPLSGWVISRFTYDNTYDNNTLWLSAQGEDRPYPNLFDNLKVTTPQGIANFTPQNSNPSLSGKSNVDGTTVVYYTWDTPDVVINNGDNVCLEWSGTVPATNTPTPTSIPATDTPTPVPNTSTPTPTPTACYECSDGWQSLSTFDYSYGTYADIAVCSTDGASNTLYWSVLDRPNRINIYSNGSVDYTTGWQGTANYAGPWGSSLNTSSTGNASFTWGSTSNRLVRIEYGPADSSNQIADAVEFNIVCNTSATATPTPTPIPVTNTPTPTPAPATATPTPAPATATPTPTPAPLGCFTYSIQNNDQSQNLTFQYRDCDGNLIQNQIVTADSGTPDFCAEEGSVSRQSGTFSWVLTTEATTCTVIPATSTPTPQPATSTPTPQPATSTPTPQPATSTPTPLPSVPSETLGDGATNTDACNDFATGTGTVRYLDDFFPFATVIYRNSDGTGTAAAGYYSDGGVWRYWNGSAFTSNGSCEVYGGQL